MDKKKAKKILRKTITGILCVIMFLSLTVGLVAATVNSVITDNSSLVIDIVDSKYNDILCDCVYAELERKMALVVIEPDDISDIITDDVIIDAAPSATGSLINRLFGGNAEVWHYENEELRTRIGALLNAYAAANDIEYEEGSTDQVYELICDTVSAEMNVIPQSYIAKVSPLFVKLGNICSYWFIPIIIYVVCTAVLIQMGRKNIKNALYNAILPSYFAAFTVCASASIMYNKDYLAKTIIKNESFQHVLRQVYNSVLENIRNTATVLSAMLLIMALIVIITTVVERKKRHSRRHRHRSVKE